MKKLFALIMCLSLVLVTGCSSSGVSQEEYDALAAENSKMESDYKKILTEKGDLTKEIEVLKSEKDRLEKELESNSNQPLTSNNLDVDVLSWMMGKPQSTIESCNTTKEADWLTTESTYYVDGSAISVKVVHTISSSVSAKKISSFIRSYELEQAAKVPDLFSNDSGIVELLVVYRYDNGKIIMTTCWYNYQNNTITYGYSWGRYGKEVEKEYSKP